MRLFGLVLALLWLCAAPSFAADNDKGLYDPKPPEGSSFIRFFNPMLEPIPTAIGQKSYGNLAPMSVTPYYVQPAGKVEFKSGLRTIPYDLAPGGFYTILLDKVGNVLLHPDPVVTDPAKAIVVFYNLGSKDPLTLKAKDGMISVISGTALGKSGNRGINPVKVDFSIFDSKDKELRKLDPVVLERGHVYSIFFANGKAVLAKGATDTTR